MSNHTNLLQTWLLPGVTVLLAIFTGVLAYFTYRMAKSTENALKQNAQLVAETHELVDINKILVESEERHHQEEMSPFVALQFYPEWNHINIDDLIDLSRIEEHIIYLKGSIFNQGRGLSNNGSLYLLCWEDVGIGPCIKIDLPILAPREAWNNKKIGDIECIEMHFIEAVFKQEIINSVGKKEWVVLLVVEDIFKNKHLTKIEPNQKSNCVYTSFDKITDEFYRKLSNRLRR
ncbi:hypothetical protein H7F10_06020 [Acidithiobacillus sp. HP-6]|uniref:hypothetical protein n=1 Tax=unclassified Acidithiobacillus TaxID=2614800 RepID=UPI00187AD25C|nr:MULTISPECIES: hypothetical protein [unclassified Acidithiobacillus]MBE7562513.1 hypothetical protein [Acidithiobacillus sp. HP-6]MBE7568012.1 hypothetical protein [Acidithiobacillus sp. HP-2]